jgi:hypothetical protein
MVEKKFFLTLPIVVNFIKLFSSSLTKSTGKLEHLSMANLSDLVNYLRIRQEPTQEYKLSVVWL